MDPPPSSSNGSGVCREERREWGVGWCSISANDCAHPIGLWIRTLISVMELGTGSDTCGLRRAGRAQHRRSHNTTHCSWKSGAATFQEAWCRDGLGTGWGGGCWWGRERKGEGKRREKKQKERKKTSPWVSWLLCLQELGDGCLPLPCLLHALCRELAAHPFPQALARKWGYESMKINYTNQAGEVTEEGGKAGP